MHRSARLRSDIPLDVNPLISLKLPNVVGAVPEQHERDPGQPIEAIGEIVLAPIDLFRDGLGVAFVGPAVKAARVPVEQRHETFPRVRVYGIGSSTKSGQARPAARHQSRNWR